MWEPTSPVAPVTRARFMSCELGREGQRRDVHAPLARFPLGVETHAWCDLAADHAERDRSQARRDQRAAHVPDVIAGVVDELRASWRAVGAHAAQPPQM